MMYSITAYLQFITALVLGIRDTLEHMCDYEFSYNMKESAPSHSLTFHSAVAASNSVIKSYIMY